MCELLAMSARMPTTIQLSFAELAAHGGRTGPHADGWGVAFHEGRDVRRIREPEPASNSRFAALLAEHAVCSRFALSHIRRATRGGRALANTQPFVRELGGRIHCFAHNGHLSGIDEQPRLRPTRYRPVGETDSEVAFCALLQRLLPLWLESGPTPPDLAERLGVVAELARELRPLGPANFIYCDGETLFAHGDRRTQRDGRVEWPGLHLLQRSCGAPQQVLADRGVTIADDHRTQQVTLVASVPLSDELWQPLTEGELLAVADGRVIARHAALEPS